MYIYIYGDIYADIHIYRAHTHTHRISLCNSGFPGTHPVDKAGLELRDLPASIYQTQGLKAWLLHWVFNTVFQLSVITGF